ncbi:MAG: LPP20 family lipoprotein [Gammaproteobacteria bacterium]
MKRLFCLPVLILLLAACSITGREAEVPDWVNGTAAAYPLERYLLGRGAGPTLALAQDRARADLAKGLRVAIEARSSERQQYRAGEGGGSNELAIERQLSTRTSEVIQGVEIAGIWQDPKAGRYHALAVLERAAAVRRLRTEIGELDRQTAARIERARRDGDPLTAIAAASAALRAQEARHALQQLLQVVDSAGGGVAPRWSLARLHADRDALLARLKIAVATPPTDAGLVPLLESALAEAGLQVVEREASDYLLAGSLALQTPESRDGWFWVRGRLSVILKQRDGRGRDSHFWALKAAGLSPPVARGRVRDEAARILRQELLQVLLGFADNP